MRSGEPSIASDEDDSSLDLSGYGGSAYASPVRARGPGGLPDVPTAHGIAGALVDDSALDVTRVRGTDEAVRSSAAQRGEANEWSRLGGDSEDPGGGAAVPVGWEARVDAATGRTFYGNKTLDVTQWEFPTEAAMGDCCVDDEKRSPDVTAGPPLTPPRAGPQSAPQSPVLLWSRWPLLVGVLAPAPGLLPRRHPAVSAGAAAAPVDRGQRADHQCPPGIRINI